MMSENKVLNTLRKFPPVVYMLVLLIILFSLLNPNYFAANNFRNVFIQCAPLMVLAFAQTLVVLTGGTNLSMNAVVNIVTVLAVFMALKGVPLVLAMVIAVVAAIGIGIFTGILIAKGHMPAFIATYGVQNVFNALALTITGGASIYYNSNLYHRVYSSSLLFIPTPVCVVIVMFIFTWILLNKSKLGMQIRALGGNREALKLAGVNVVRSEITVYAVAGFLGGIAGLLTLCRVESGQPIVANGWEFQSVAAAILGGSSFKEGKGGVTGTIFGVLLIQIAQNGLNVIGVQAIYQSVLVGSIVLAAIIIDAVVRMRRRD